MKMIDWRQMIVCRRGFANRGTPVGCGSERLFADVKAGWESQSLKRIQ
jgi:hypothetical protein